MTSLPIPCSILFFFNDTATTEIYTLSLHDALPISRCRRGSRGSPCSCCRRCAPMTAPCSPPATRRGSPACWWRGGTTRGRGGGSRPGRRRGRGGGRAPVRERERGGWGKRVGVRGCRVIEKKK